MAAVLFAVGSSLFKASESSSAKRKVKKERKRQQRLDRLMTSEEIRRLGKEQEQVLGTAKGQIASSGFTGYGASTEAYLADLQSEQSKELQFTKSAGAGRAQQIRRQGKAQESAYQSQMYSDILGGVQAVGESFNWGMKTE